MSDHAPTPRHDQTPTPRGASTPAQPRRTIATLPPRLRELGRLRLGRLVATDDGKRRPAALDTWRLTSPSRRLVDAAAEHVGGTVGAWTPPDGSGDAWELVTETGELDALIPPSEPLSQTYERWTGAGCVRRCDGLVRDTGERCDCPTDHNERNEQAKDGGACFPTTRLRVMLPWLPDLGCWVLTSRGFYAATELHAVGAIVDIATASGRLLAVRLRIEHRQVRRIGEPVKRFVVPVVESDATLDQLLAQAGAVDAIAGPVPAAAALAAGPAGPDGPDESPGDSARMTRGASGAPIETIVARLDAAAIPPRHTLALLAARYGAPTDGTVGEALEVLTDDRRAALAATLEDDAGVERFRTAAAADAAAADVPF